LLSDYTTIPAVGGQPFRVSSRKISCSFLCRGGPAVELVREGSPILGGEVRGVSPYLTSAAKFKRARITQIMALLNLAPDIHEAILFLEPMKQGKDQVTERELRPIVAVAD
jgi:hypothetical protein